MCCVTLPYVFLYYDLPLSELCLLLKVREIVMIITKYSTFVTVVLWENINNDTRILIGEMSQWYIRALADLLL